jgi:hypothetical protein
MMDQPTSVALDSVVCLIADGVDIDWAAQAAQLTDMTAIRTLHQLRLVARIAQVHRDCAAEEDASCGAPVTPADHRCIGSRSNDALSSRSRK